MAILYNGTFANDPRTFTVPTVFSARALRITTLPNSTITTNSLVLQTSYLIPVGADWIQVADRRKLSWDEIIIPPYKNYRLLFWQYPWIDGGNIQIQDVSLTNIMSVTYPNSTVASNLCNITSVVASASSVVLLPANTSRTGGGLIINNTSKKLFVNFGSSPATLTPPSIEVVQNGGNIDIPVGYQGEIRGIWNGTDGTKSAAIYEFVSG